MMAEPLVSTRAMLRRYQRARAELDGAELDQALGFVQAKDLDLSVRHGALLAADGLLASAAINPIAASPGAPLSLNAAEQPWEVAAVCLGVALVLLAAFVGLRSIIRGEEFDLTAGAEESSEIFAQRLLAAYCFSIDDQIAALRRASALTIAGLAAMVAWGWILLAKLNASAGIPA